MPRQGRFFADAGVDIVDTVRYDLGPGWRQLQTFEIYDNGGQWYVRPEACMWHCLRLAGVTSTIGGGGRLFECGLPDRSASPIAFDQLS